MNYDPVNCPRCEAEQLFVPKMKESEQGWLEEYIRCTVCRFQIVIRQTTHEIEVLAARIRGLEERSRWEEQRHGAASSTLIDRLSLLRIERSKLIGDLAKEVAAHGESAHPDAA